MTDYVTAYTTVGNPYHREAKSLALRLRDQTNILAGVIRWNSNTTVPPVECVALAAHIGLPVDVAACNRVRDAETAAFLAEYRRRDRGPTAEQRAEMRAAFGPGKKVVNVITGRVTKT